MSLFRNMYFTLYNALTDAIEAIDAGDPQRAKAILMEADRETELEYPSAAEEDDEYRAEIFRNAAKRIKQLEETGPVTFNLFEEDEFKLF